MTGTTDMMNLYFCNYLLFVIFFFAADGRDRRRHPIRFAADEGPHRLDFLLKEMEWCIFSLF